MSKSFEQEVREILDITELNEIPATLEVVVQELLKSHKEAVVAEPESLWDKRHYVGRTDAMGITKDDIDRFLAKLKGGGE